MENSSSPPVGCRRRFLRLLGRALPFLLPLFLLALAPGATCPATAHRPGLLLLDGTATEAACLDYHGLRTHTVDAAGNLETVTLRIPAGTPLPPNLEAVLMLDVFPRARRALGSRE